MRFKRFIFLVGFVMIQQTQAQMWERIAIDSSEVGWGDSGVGSKSVIYAKGQLLYIGTTKGLLRSNDGGLNWRRLTIATGLPDSVVNAMAIALEDASVLYVSIGYRFSGYENSTLYKSTDSGETWKIVFDSTVVKKPNIANVEVSPLNPNLILNLHRAIGPGAGNLDEIFRSTDGGTTWKDVSSSSFGLSDHGVRIEIGHDPINSTQWYATGDTQFDVSFYASTNSGLTWSVKSSPYIGTSRGILSSGGGLVYLMGAGAAIHISIDGGSSWVGDYSINNSGRRLYKLAIHPRNQDILLAATTDGVWVKDLVSGKWSQVVGLPTGEYYDVFVDSTTGYIYAGGKVGLFRSSTIITDVPKLPTDLPNEFLLFQNYPNPFNPTTTIQYTVPKRAPIKLILYDVLGKEVRILEDGIKEAGTYSIVFNAAGLQSGVYIYRLISEGYTEVKKMVLLK